LEGVKSRTLELNVTRKGTADNASYVAGASVLFNDITAVGPARQKEALLSRNSTHQLQTVKHRIAHRKAE
jgi:hypothetical protein